MSFRDEGVVLRRIPYGDTSLVIHLFTRESGRLALLARGARKAGRGSGAALAGFHTLELHFTRRGELGHLQQAEIVAGRHRLPGAPLGGAAALVLLEGVSRFLAPDDTHIELYQELTQALDLLEQGEDALAVVAVGVARLAQRVGYGWRMDACAGCGSGAGLAFFSVKRGQAVCRSCGAPYAPRLIPVDAPLGALLTHLAWPQREGLSPADEKMYGMLYRLALQVLERHGGKLLQADAPFRQLLEGDGRTRDAEGAQQGAAKAKHEHADSGRYG